MTGVIATIPRFQFLDANAEPLVGGMMEVYLAGTTTPTPSWQDQALTILNTNPIVLDSRGHTMIWLDSRIKYKFILKNRGGALQWSQDNIVGGNIAGDPSFSIYTAAIYAAVNAAAASAGQAIDAASYLASYIDSVVMNITFPLDLGLIIDPVAPYNTFDLGVI